MEITFDDNDLHLRFAPLTLTRPVAELRFGIHTISESWIKLLKDHLEIGKVTYLTEAYLSEKYKSPGSSEGIFIAGNVKPNPELAELVSALNPGEKLVVDGKWIASFGKEANVVVERTVENLLLLEHTWDLFQKLGEAIQSDFKHATEGSQTQFILSNTNQIRGLNNIRIEEGTKIENAILNAETGPIYIGKNAEIMEGAIIRGPFVLGDHSTVKMGAKIYGPTVIGPFCKVGGEISNSLFMAYSNKGHDGFLGNSVIGEWCNLGADTNSSNLKNNYGNVKIYSYESKQMEQTDVMFCGLTMGDHSKTGINTMLNTATVVGVSANIFGGGFPDKYIPSFTWGGCDRNDRFVLEKAFEVAENMMKRRNVTLSDEERSILSHLYNTEQ